MRLRKQHGQPYPTLVGAEADAGARGFRVGLEGGGLLAGADAVVDPEAGAGLGRPASVHVAVVVATFAGQPFRGQCAGDVTVFHEDDAGLVVGAPVEVVGVDDIGVAMMNVLEHKAARDRLSTGVHGARVAPLRCGRSGPAENWTRDPIGPAENWARSTDPVGPAENWDRDPIGRVENWDRSIHSSGRVENWDGDL